MRLNACFQINFLKTIKILIEMRKTHQADEPFLLACCSAKFLLFKNVCFSEISCASITANLLFVNTAKLLLESKVCNFRFCFRFVWRNRRWDLSLVTWPAVALCYMCRVKLAPRARQFHWAITKHLPISMQRQRKSLLAHANMLFKAGKKIQWKVIDANHCLFADGEREMPEARSMPSRYNKSPDSNI